jgi:hypothetical protein
VSAVAALLAELANTTIPPLRNRACNGAWAIMDDIESPEPAQALCAGCEALEACSAWAHTQPRKTLYGIVAGEVYATYPARERPPRKAASAS